MTPRDPLKPASPQPFTVLPRENMCRDRVLDPGPSARLLDDLQDAALEGLPATETNTLSQWLYHVPRCCNHRSMSSRQASSKKTTRALFPLPIPMARRLLRSRPGIFRSTSSTLLTPVHPCTPKVGHPFGKVPTYLSRPSWNSFRFHIIRPLKLFRKICVLVSRGMLSLAFMRIHLLEQFEKVV